MKSQSFFDKQRIIRINSDLSKFMINTICNTINLTKPVDNICYFREILL